MRLRLAHPSVKESLILDRIRQSRARIYGALEEDANVSGFLLQLEVTNCPGGIAGVGLGRYGNGNAGGVCRQWEVAKE
jgi:hypothetical protein